MLGRVGDLPATPPGRHSREASMSKEKFLAVAFTDTDENGRFNPTKDALIAGIIDED